MEYREAAPLPAELRTEHVLAGAAVVSVRGDDVDSAEQRERGEGLVVRGRGEPDGEAETGKAEGSALRE